MGFCCGGWLPLYNGERGGFLLHHGRGGGFHLSGNRRGDSLLYGGGRRDFHLYGRREGDFLISGGRRVDFLSLSDWGIPDKIERKYLWSQLCLLTEASIRDWYTSARSSNLIILISKL